MVITVEHLSKRFAREWVLREVNLTLRSGTAYAITGPNGSGKSTLVSLIAGIVLPTKGVVLYEKNSKKIEAEQFYEHLSWAAPYIDLIEEFTLKEMVEFHFRFKTPVDGLNVKQIIDKMELSHATNKSIHNFSSGMKQRLKLGLALFSEVEVTILDEPTSNLDVQAIDWYTQQLDGIKARMMLICSNQTREYDWVEERIKIMDFK